MTDTLHKNPESRTVCNTPETDEFERSECDGNESSLSFARKLERERNEAVNSCKIWQAGHSKLVEDCNHRTNKIAAEREGWKKIAVELEKGIEKLKDALEDLVLDSALFCDNMKSHKQAKEALEEWKH